MSPGELCSGLFIQHTDKDVFVLVDGLHYLRMGLTEADQEGLEEVGVVEDLVSQELEFINITKECKRIVFA